MVVGKIGRAETSTDPAPINMTETIITFKPRIEWPEGTTKDDILRRLDEKLRMPGVTNIWTQPIRNRLDMLSTGIRTQVGVKVFGTDLRVIEEKSVEIERVLRGVRGAVDLYAERINGAPYLEIDIDRLAAARFGATVGDIQDVIETAIGGKNVTFTVEARERYPVRVRYARDFREDIESLRNVLVSGPDGAQVPLGEVAHLHIAVGPSMISSENALLRGTVLMNVRGRDAGSFADEAKRLVAEKVSMPPGYYVEWSGQYENQIRAKQRLQIVVPIVVLIIFVLLYLTYRSAKEALHVLLAVPFALTGGVFLLKLLGYNFSVAVWVGFIALFVTAMDLGLAVAVDPPTLNLRVVRQNAETAAIRQALVRTSGNISRTAELLGITRPTLYDLMSKYGIRADSAEPPSMEALRPTKSEKSSGVA
jgi:Cu(I)/Ag(I) efflux system membrane protein CusA/SilA